MPFLVLNSFKTSFFHMSFKHPFFTPTEALGWFELLFDREARVQIVPNREIVVVDVVLYVKIGFVS